VTAERRSLRNDSSIVNASLDSRHVADGPSNLIEHVQELVFVDMLQVAVVRKNFQSLLNDNPQNGWSDISEREGSSQSVWLRALVVGVLPLVIRVYVSFLRVLIVRGFVL
jgi:hypothetical protein